MPKTKQKPSLKTSIYLYPDTKVILDAREVGQGTRSEVIRACVERYAEICRRELPDLSVDEWRSVVEVLNERWLAEAPQAIYIPAALGDSEAPLAKSLAKKTGDMFYSELVAILDTAERYWAAKARGEKPKLPGEK